MRRSLPSILALPILALGACKPAATSDNAQPAPDASIAPPPITSAPPGDRIASSARLAGEYRIAGADGKDIDLPHGITASISDRRIEVAAGCVTAAWVYRFEGERLITERVPLESCARGLFPEEQAIIDAFDTATAVAVTRANGIEFTGSGRSVTLFSQ